MSGTHLLFAHSDYNFLLRNEPDKRGRMTRVAYLRDHAIMMLEDAIKRIPFDKPSIMAAYRDRGIEPVWVLTDGDHAKRFCSILSDFNPTPNEIHAGELLRACVWAEEIGDIPEFKLMHAGRAASRNPINASKFPRGTGKSATPEDVAQYVKDKLNKLKFESVVSDAAAHFVTSESTITRRIKAAKEAGLLS